MSTKFLDAIDNTPEVTTTTNGAKAFKNTGSGLVDFFYEVPVMRKDQERVFGKWATAYGEDKITALRMAFWLRDVRGGAGERASFRTVLKWLERRDKQTLLKLIPLVPEYGRWDDLLVFTDRDVRDCAYKVIQGALEGGNGLCAKWMPRKGAVAEDLRNYIGFTPKRYRKTLVTLTKVVEQQMCANQWNEIEYSHVPSVASARYRNAFVKHDKDRYESYISDVNSGDAVINADALFPHDVLKTMRSGGEETANAMWKALPNYMEGGASILPMIDTSSSMECESAAQGFTCMDIAVTLGMYIAMKNEGPFKGAWLNFNSNSHIKHIKAQEFSDVYNTLHRDSDWGGSTDIESAFRSILDLASKNNLKQEDMPKVLLILSDMQFNGETYHDPVRNLSALQMMKREYKQAGYDVPNVVYWNLNSGYGNVPVKKSKEGVALVSGFNPSILKSLLSGEIQSPESIMLKTVFDSRYDAIEQAVS